MRSSNKDHPHVICCGCGCLLLATPLMCAQACPKVAKDAGWSSTCTNPIHPHAQQPSSECTPNNDSLRLTAVRAVYPVETNNLNYAPTAVGIVFLGTLTAWFFPRWGARHWYTGPRALQLGPWPRNKQHSAEAESVQPMMASMQAICTSEPAGRPDTHQAHA